MRLDIGIPAAKELAGPLAGDFFRDIHSITAAIIALTGVALGIFVGQAGAHG